MTCLNLLEKAVSFLGLLEESITLFEWTKIYVSLFECLGMLKFNRDLIRAYWTKV